MSTIYLAGKMEDKSTEEQTGWRNYVTLPLVNEGWTVLNPVHRSMKDGYNHRRIYELDMRDVRSSDVILADLRRSDGECYGTAMELQEAYTRNIPIVGFAIQDQRKHPFLEVVVTEWHTDWDSAIKVLNEFYK